MLSKHGSYPKSVVHQRARIMLGKCKSCLRSVLRENRALHAQVLLFRCICQLIHCLPCCHRPLQPHLELCKRGFETVYQNTEGAAKSGVLRVTFCALSGETR